jgi:hypothetical protein
MHTDTGIIKVIQVDSLGDRAASIECPAQLIPSPGRYIIAVNPNDKDAALGHCLFLSGLQENLDTPIPSLLGPIPETWVPGTNLTLCGPLGKGFRIEPGLRRLALTTFSGTLTRLLPIVSSALEKSIDIAAFLPEQLIPVELPMAIEVHPLSLLFEFLTWADLLVIEIPLSNLSKLRGWLNLGPHDPLPCSTQALILTPMPCAAIADCGTCAVSSRKGKIKLVCKDGPVLDLYQLNW